MSERVHDVAIVGGGIVGAACAFVLARRGLRVLLLERRFIGGGATAAGMGHVVVLDDSPAQLALTRYSRALWDGWADDLPVDVEFTRPGTLWIAADDEEMAGVREKHAMLTCSDVQSEVLDAAALREAEPQLRAGLAGGLRVPGDAVLYPPCAARVLAERAGAAGAALRVGAGVASIDEQGVRLDGGERIAAARVVLATGSWAPELLPGVDVRPRKGHLVITERHPGVVGHQLLELGYLKSAHASTADSVAFNLQPRPTGQLLLGSSRQMDIDDDLIDDTIVQRMLARALEYMPSLATATVLRVWTGLRAATADKLPLIGPCPGRSGLWLATGHEGLGITTAPATAELLAAQICGDSPPIDPAPYLPARAHAGGGHV